MSTIVFSIPNISCEHCVHTIQTEIAELKGVKYVKADAATKKVEIGYEAPATEEEIKNLLAEISYPAAE